MALIREKDGKRLHIKSKLMGESLVSKTLLKDLDVAPQQRLFPDVNIMKIGGQSISDRCAKALPGIIKEIGLNRDRHKMLITTGGGTRSRHCCFCPGKVLHGGAGADKRFCGIKPPHF